MNEKEQATKIATDIRRMAEWVESRPEGGIYPVSFFSEAADRLQMIHRELQVLEESQCELVVGRIRKDGEGNLPQTPVNEVAFVMPVAKEGLSGEDSSTGSLHEGYRKRRFHDLITALSLNDCIRFCKQLFDKDERLMNRSLETLNGCVNIEDSLRFLSQLKSWPSAENEVTKEFMEIIKLRFS